MTLKTLDGVSEIQDAALFAVLTRLVLLTDEEQQALASVALKPIRNSRGAIVGQRHAI